MGYPEASWRRATPNGTVHRVSSLSGASARCPGVRFYHERIRQGEVEGVTRVELLGTAELKEKLDRADDFKLVMVLGDWEYRTMHIPGSLRIDTVEVGLEALDPDEEVVVYDSGASCVASWRAYRVLKDHGYEHVRRYAGGLEEWERAGYPLEGSAHRRG